MSGKLWVDDLRDPPDETWTVARSSGQAVQQICLLWVRGKRWDVMSLDHDLGGADTTRRIVLWLCEVNDRWPLEVQVHTANPVGREWLEGMIARYMPK